MKIRITESEIEASAEELNASATFREAFLDVLRNTFLKVGRPLSPEIWDADDEEPEDADD